MSRLLALLCLLSVANCEDFGIISSSKRTSPTRYFLSKVVEDIEWRQPVCVVPAQDAPPCFLALQQLHNEYSQIDKQFSEDDVAAHLRVKKASEVREKINLNEIEPSSLAEESVEIRVKSSDGSTPSLDVINEKVEISDKRSRAKLPIEERPLPILVTKVIISPVTATIVAQHCFPDIGVPLCAQREQIVTSRQNQPNKFPLEVPVLGLKDSKVSLFKLFSDFFSKWKSTSNVTSSATVSNLDGVVSLDVEAATDGDVTKIDQQTEIPIAIVDSEPTVIELLADDLSHKKDIITQTIANKKEHVAETVSSLAAMKEGIVRGIVDKTEQVAEAITAAKQGFGQGIVDTKDKVIETVTTAKQAIKQGIADEIVKIDQQTEIPIAIVDSEPTVIELLADELSHKKDIITQAIANKKKHVAETVSSLAAMKEGIVRGIVDKTEQVAEAVTAAKQGFVQGIVDTKDKVIETVTTAKQAIKQGIADEIAKMDQQTEIPVAIVDSEPTVIELLADDLSHKKDIITQAIANKKKHVAETVSSLAAMKEGIVRGIVDKTEQVAEAVTAAKQGFVQGIVDTKDKVIETVTTAKQAIKQGIADEIEGLAKTTGYAVAIKHRMLNDLAQMFFNSINEKYQRARDLKNLVLGAIIDTMNRKKESLLQLEQDTRITIAKKHEIMVNISRAIVDSILDAVQKKKEAVEGATEHAKDFAVNTTTKKYQLLKKFKNMVINAIHEVNGMKHETFSRVSEAVTNATAAKKEAIAHKIEEAKIHYRKLVAISYKALQGIIDEKINWSLDLANKKQELIQSITDSKVGIINAMSSKKQGILKSIIDKKIDAIKKMSEKTQEFISAASLAVPLLISTIKQHVGLNQARSLDDQMCDNEGSGDDFGFEESTEINERLTETSDTGSQATQAQETNDTASTDTSANATDPDKLMTRKDDSGYFDEVDSADESIPEMHEIMGDEFSVDERPTSRLFPRLPALYSMSPVPGYETKQSPNSELGLLGVVQTVTNKKFSIIAYKLEQITKLIERILNMAGLSMQPPTARNETTTQSSGPSAANDPTTVKPPANTSAAADSSVPGLPANLGLPAQVGNILALLGLPAGGGQQPVPDFQAMHAHQVLASLQAISSMYPNSPSSPNRLPTQPPRTEDLVDYDPVDEEGILSPSGRPTPKPQLPWNGNLVLPSFNDQVNAGSNQLQEHFNHPEASSHSENVIFNPTPNEWPQGETRKNTSANVNEYEEPGIEIVYRPETRSSSKGPESSTIGQDNKPDDEKPVEIVHSGPVVHEYSHIESLSSATPSETPSPQDSIVAAEDPIYDEEEEGEEVKPCVSCQMPAQFAFPAKAARKNVTSEAEAAKKTAKKTTTL